MALALTLIAGIFFLVGAFVAWRVSNRERVEAYSVAIAFGALFCVAVIDLVPELPEIAEELGWFAVIALVLAGLAILFMLDRAMPEPHGGDGEEGAAHIGIMAVLAVSVHNLAEGAAIFTVASQDASAGAALALGVGLHNAPLGMLLYSVLEGGRARGIVLLAAAALSTFAGGLLIFVFGSELDETVLSCIMCPALGMIIYILFLELLPTMLHEGTVKRNAIGALIGAAFVVAGVMLG